MKNKLKTIALTLIAALIITAMPVGTVTAEAASKPAQVKNLKTNRVLNTEIAISFRSVKKAKGYQVCVYDSKKKLVKKQNAHKGQYREVVIRNLKKGKKYTIKVRAYTIVNKKKVYGKYSKSITAKTSSLTVGDIKNLRITKATKNSVTLKWDKAKNAYYYDVNVRKNGIQYKSAMPRTNTVTIKGLKQNTTYNITVQAYNKNIFGKEASIPCTIKNGKVVKVVPPGESTKTGSALKKQYEAWRDNWIGLHADYELQDMLNETFTISDKYNTMYDLYKYKTGNTDAIIHMYADFYNKMGIKTTIKYATEDTLSCLNAGDCYCTYTQSGYDFLICVDREDNKLHTYSN